MVEKHIMLSRREGQEKLKNEVEAESERQQLEEEARDHAQIEFFAENLARKRTNPVSPERNRGSRRPPLGFSLSPSSWQSSSDKDLAKVASSEIIKHLADNLPFCEGEPRHTPESNNPINSRGTRITSGFGSPRSEGSKRPIPTGNSYPNNTSESGKSLHEIEVGLFMSSLLKEIEYQDNDLHSVQTGSEDANPGLKRNLVEVTRYVKHAKHRIKSLEAERKGLVDMVDVLTRSDSLDDNSNAISEAAINDGRVKGTLPLHITQLLEIIPWDDRAKEHISFTEEVYEWQYYLKGQGWTKDIQKFPPCFLKTLPVTKPASTHLKRVVEPSPSSSSRHEITSRPATFGCVITDMAATHILDLESGFCLPSEGTWNWVGGWTVDKEDGLACDSDGWSYASVAKHLAERQKSKCFPHSVKEDDEQECQALDFRVRKWSRLRVLVSYPFIGETTKNFLSLSAQNASLAVTISKLSNQLLDAQSKLVEREKEMSRFHELHEQVECLMEVVKEKDRKVQQLQDAFMRSNTERSSLLKLSVRSASFKENAPCRTEQSDCDDNRTVSTLSSTASSSSEATVVCNISPPGPTTSTNGKDWTRNMRDAIFARIITRQIIARKVGKEPESLNGHGPVTTLAKVEHPRDPILEHESSDCVGKSSQGLSELEMVPKDEHENILEDASDEKRQRNTMINSLNHKMNAPAFQVAPRRKDGGNAVVVKATEPSFEYSPHLGHVESSLKQLSVSALHQHDQEGDSGPCFAVAAASLSDMRRQELTLWMQMEPDFE